MVEALIILLSLVFGVIAGTITGLTPGLHINLIAAFILTLPYGNPLILSCFIVAMAITHTFLDFLPSIFLGLPQEDTALSLLPGHRFLLKGYGYSAAKLTLIGSFYGFILALIFLPIYFKILPLTWPYLKKTVPFFLLGVSLWLILKENKKILALITFLFAGVFGILTLNLKVLSQPLLPLFTSLFGLPLLFLSIKNKVKIKKQKITDLKIKRREKIRPLFAGLLSSALVSIYPALGPGQAAIIGSDLFGRLNTKSFLILLGSINTIVMLFSFISTYAINKPRTGIAVSLLNLLGEITFKQVLFFLVVAFIAACFSVFIFIFISKIIAKNINKINYSLLCLIGLIFIITINLLVSGIYSLFILAVGFFIGLIPNLKGLRRIHLMGCLVLPVLSFYF